VRSNKIRKVEDEDDELRITQEHKVFCFQTIPEFRNLDVREVLQLGGEGYFSLRYMQYTRKHNYFMNHISLRLRPFGVDKRHLLD
jgi:hypothetical protein